MWCKAANTATALDGITVPSHENKCSYELCYGKTPHYMESLHTFGEIAVSKDPVNISTNWTYAEESVCSSGTLKTIHKKSTCI